MLSSSSSSSCTPPKKYARFPIVLTATHIPVRGDGRVPLNFTDCHFHFVPVVSCSAIKNYVLDECFTMCYVTKLLSGASTKASVWMIPLSISFLILFLLYPPVIRTRPSGSATIWHPDLGAGATPAIEHSWIDVWKSAQMTEVPAGSILRHVLDSRSNIWTSLKYL